MRRRFLCMAFVAYAVVPCCGKCAEPGKRIADEVVPLANRFVQALKDNNIVGYSQCWVSGALFCDVNASIYQLTDEDLAHMKKYYLQRDREIAAFFSALRVELGRLAGDLSRISLDSVSVSDLKEVRNKRGDIQRALGDIVVRIRIDSKRVVHLDLDDGADIGGHWYFSDSPKSRMKLIVVREGKEKLSRTIRFDLNTTGATPRPETGGAPAPRD